MHVRLLYLGADLALLYLSRPSKHATIRPAMSPADDDWSKPNTQAIVAGWGSTSTSSKDLSPVLRYASVKVKPCRNVSTFNFML